MNGMPNIVFTALAPCATASGTPPEGKVVLVEFRHIAGHALGEVHVGEAAAKRIEEALDRLLAAGSS
jgi:hypothetical protein